MGGNHEKEAKADCSGHHAPWVDFGFYPLCNNKTTKITIMLIPHSKKAWKRISLFHLENEVSQKLENNLETARLGVWHGIEHSWSLGREPRLGRVWELGHWVPDWQGPGQSLSRGPWEQEPFSMVAATGRKVGIELWGTNKPKKSQYFRLSRAAQFSKQL